MRGKKYMMGVAAGAMILAGTTLSAGAAPAQQTPPPAPAVGQAQCGLGQQGAGAYGRWGGEFNTSDTVASLLGMTQDEIAALRQEGKSLVDIAATKGIDQAALVNELLAERKAEVQAQVDAGTITQAQADYMLQQMETRIVQAVTRTEIGPMGPVDGAGQGLGQAGNRGMRAQNESGTTAPRLNQNGTATPQQNLGPRMGGGFGGGR
ncbi:MAG: hypothetical protein M0Z94_00315 [Dehalococcoidales bacterium]|nr:hypothetical protein [Dehalococcoidales bacterium]